MCVHTHQDGNEGPLASHRLHEDGVRLYTVAYNFEGMPKSILPVSEKEKTKEE